MQRRLVLAGLAALLVVLAGAVPAQARSDREHVVAGYFASWDIYARGYFPKQIPADHVSHLNYAFAYPVGPNDRYGYEEGTCAAGRPLGGFPAGALERRHERRRRRR
jgi:hypothetical protein